MIHSATATLMLPLGQWASLGSVRTHGVISVAPTVPPGVGLSPSLAVSIAVATGTIG